MKQIKNFNQYSRYCLTNGILFSQSSVMSSWKNLEKQYLYLATNAAVVTSSLYDDVTTKFVVTKMLDFKASKCLNEDFRQSLTRGRLFYLSSIKFLCKNFGEKYLCLAENPTVVISSLCGVVTMKHLLAEGLLQGREKTWTSTPDIP